MYAQIGLSVKQYEVLFRKITQETPAMFNAEKQQE